jgi:hypothetical protein|eukprot:TRINITY_DN17_c0_g1_i1.p2 TRINITY_DN17_c0_g1~~TRINITY_DN17_c0_g1_i1.p2  ORF type:complete len:113 (+),score=2.60 TRINITY_DN17_c0_g1_i1:33-341(+)
MGNKQLYSTPYGAYGPKVPRVGGPVQNVYPPREGLVPVGNLGGAGYGYALDPNAGYGGQSMAPGYGGYSVAPSYGSPYGPATYGASPYGPAPVTYAAPYAPY